MGHDWRRNRPDSLLDRGIVVVDLAAKLRRVPPGPDPGRWHFALRVGPRASNRLADRAGVKTSGKLVPLITAIAVALFLESTAPAARAFRQSPPGFSLRSGHSHAARRLGDATPEDRRGDRRSGGFAGCRRDTPPAGTAAPGREADPSGPVDAGRERESASGPLDGDRRRSRDSLQLHPGRLARRRGGRIVGDEVPDRSTLISA